MYKYNNQNIKIKHFRWAAMPLPLSLTLVLLWAVLQLLCFAGCVLAEEVIVQDGAWTLSFVDFETGAVRYQKTLDSRGLGAIDSQIIGPDGLLYVGYRQPNVGVSIARYRKYDIEIIFSDIVAAPGTLAGDTISEMRFDPDGNLYVLLSQKTITRIRLDSLTRDEVVNTSSLGVHSFNKFEFDSAGRLLILAMRDENAPFLQSIIRYNEITPNAAASLVQSSESSRLTNSFTISPEGDIYAVVLVPNDSLIVRYDGMTGEEKEIIFRSSEVEESPFIGFSGQLFIDRSGTLWAKLNSSRWAKLNRETGELLGFSTGLIGYAELYEPAPPTSCTSLFRQAFIAGGPLFSDQKHLFQGLSVYRPGSGSWFFSNPDPADSAFLSLQWGLSSDVPFLADLSGDGVNELIVYRPNVRKWFIKNPVNGEVAFCALGTFGAKPLIADFDGDGKKDLAYLRRSEGSPQLIELVYSKSSTGGQSVDKLSFELASNVQFSDFFLPVPCDYDGNGRDEAALFNTRTGHWLQLQENGEMRDFAYGLAGDIPVPADYNGDGVCEPALWRPVTGEWFVWPSQAPVQFGLGGDIPTPFDVDHDGQADYVVYRPVTGEWYFKTANGISSKQFGLNSDSLPHRAAYYYAARNALVDEFNAVRDAEYGNDTNLTFVSRQAKKLFSLKLTQEPFSLGLSSRTIVSYPTLDIRSDSQLLSGDFSENFGDEIVVYTPRFFGNSSGFNIYNNDVLVKTVLWGEPMDTPVAADLDCDGKPEIIAYRQKPGEVNQWWVIRSSDGLGRIYDWGLSGDLPVPGDYDGDGCDELAVWRPANGTWYVFNEFGIPEITQWGLPGDTPLLADIDADGREDKIIWRRGMWYSLLSGGGTKILRWGRDGDQPLVGDFLAGGVDFALYRAAEKKVYILDQDGRRTFTAQLDVNFSDIDFVGKTTYLHSGGGGAFDGV